VLESHYFAKAGIDMWKRAAIVAIMIGQPMAAGIPSAQESGFKIVVNSQNSISSVSSGQLSSLYARKLKTWDNGEPVQPVHQVANPVRDAFSRDVPGAGSVQPGEPPTPAVSSDRDVLAYVRLKPGAIGYVSAAAPVDGVKVVSFGRAGEISPKTASMDPLPVGGAIAAPVRLSEVRPMYPQIARDGRVTGTVKLLIVIGPTGNVERATVVESVPMLDDAAVRAVKQWKYAPTKVNNVAVPVSMTVGVAFKL
jgi:TonB family protein